MISKVSDIKEGFSVRREGVDDADPLKIGQLFLKLGKRQVHVVGKELRLEPGRVPLGNAVVVGTGPETRKGQARLPRDSGKFFVAPEFRFQGTCYRAANWRYVGETRGIAKSGNGHCYHGQPKAVYLYPLTKDFRERLHA